MSILKKISRFFIEIKEEFKNSNEENKVEEPLEDKETKDEFSEINDVHDYYYGYQELMENTDNVSVEQMRKYRESAIRKSEEYEEYYNRHAYKILKDTGRVWNELAFTEAFAAKRQAIVFETKKRVPRFNVSYENEDIKYIYENLFKLCPNTEMMEEVIVIICDSMEKYEFDKTSSVRGVTVTDTDYYRKRKISLLKHTRHILQVLVEEIQVSKASINYRKRYESYVVALAAVLHDFGKSEKLIKDCNFLDYENIKDKHAYISTAYMVEAIIYKIQNAYLSGVRFSVNNRFFIKELFFISEAISMHHYKNLRDNLDLCEAESLAGVLQKLDLDTRAYEDELLNENKVKLMRDE